MNNDDDKQGSQASTDKETPMSELLTSFTTQKWKDQDLLLKKLWFQGETQANIAKILHRSPAAVMTRAARLGLPRRIASGRKFGSKNIPSDPSQNANKQRAPYKRSEKSSDSIKMQELTDRVCLMCLRTFASLGKYNRICPDCKESSEYRAATSLAEISINN